MRGRSRFSDTAKRCPAGWRGNRRRLGNAGANYTEANHVEEVFTDDRRHAGALVERWPGYGAEDGRRAQVRHAQRQAGPRPGAHIDRRRLHADCHDLQQPDPREPRAQGRAAARPHLGGQRGQLGVDVPPRQDAKFTNGRPVTAHDVKFSFDRILDPETASRGRKAMGPIETITAVDDHTLVIKLAGPYADLPLQLGNTSPGSSPRRTWRRSATTRSARGRSSSRSTSPATRRSW